MYREGEREREKERERERERQKERERERESHRARQPHRNNPRSFHDRTKAVPDSHDPHPPRLLLIKSQQEPRQLRPSCQGAH